jgi:hypothetical protein
VAVPHTFVGVLVPQLNAAIIPLILRLINGIPIAIALMFYAGLCVLFKYKLFPSDIITTE